ncbi:TPA: hypothetical protein ACX6SR_000306 [Photobacterium damselae]
MKYMIYFIFIFIVHIAEGANNRTTVALSPSLSRYDIKKIYLADNYFRLAKDNKMALKILEPYIHDKDNILARYIYASALAKFDINMSLTILKELTNDGYPYAMDTYGEKRTCKLDKYQNICLSQGYTKLLNSSYVAWKKHDPSELYNKSYQDFLDIPWNRRVNKDHTWFSSEAEKYLRQCADYGIFQCANELQRGFYFVKNKTKKQEFEYKYYRELAKNSLINVNDIFLDISFIESCFNMQSGRDDEICLNSEEYNTMLDNLAKKGGIMSYQFLFRTINKKEYKNKQYVNISSYLRNRDMSLPKKLKSIYDRSIELNYSGWKLIPRSYSIEPWEKLHNDESLSGFFNKVNKLDSE